MARTEKAHIIPQYIFPNNNPDNINEMTRPLHAFLHYLIGDAQPKSSLDKKRNMYACHSIKERCNLDEKTEIDTLLDLHRRDRDAGNWP